MLPEPLCRLQLIKTLKQSDTITPEIELGCGDINLEQISIYVHYYLFILKKKMLFQGAE